MADIITPPAGIPDLSQAAELALLVDLEARWENLRKTRPSGPAASPSRQDLEARQKAYDAFHARLVVYNRRYTPVHVPELLLNTPPRLAAWCRAMRELYAQIEHVPQGRCPVHLLEKAYRWADRIGDRLHCGLVDRAPPPGTVGAAIRDLDVLARWCDDLTGVMPTVA